MKTETWNGHEVRFVFKGGEWWAVLIDIAKALDVDRRVLSMRLSERVRSTHPVQDGAYLVQKATIINEPGVCQAILKSRKPDTRGFSEWVSETFENLRNQ